MSQLNAEFIARALGNGKEFANGQPGSWNTCCPAHNDDGPSLTVTDGIGGKLVVFCHAKCDQRDVVDALKKLRLWPTNSGQHQPKEWVVLPHAPDSAPRITTMQHPRLGAATGIWEYRDAQNRVVGYAGRFDLPNGKKELSFLTWCRDPKTDKEQWAWKSFLKPRVLYNGQTLPNNTKPVLVVEGEKTADAASRLFADYVVITWPGGGKAVKYANWEQLADREVIIWPDNDDPGRKTASTIAEILLLGGAKVRIVDVPENLGKGWDLADPVPPDLTIDIYGMVRMAPSYTGGGEDVIQRYNKEFALVLIGDKTAIAWERLANDPDKPANFIDVDFISTAAFNQLFGNEYVQLGRREEPAPKYWMGHERRRTYTRVVFSPGRETGRDFNLWRGFAYEPDPDGDWSLFDEHLRENVACGDESLYKWVVAWFAQIVQQPSVLPGTSLSLRGNMGSGKTIVGQHMGALFPQHYVYVDDTRYVIGQFNSHMASSILLHADEAFFAGDPRHAGRLKGMVTAKTNRIEKKGIDSIEVRNYQRLLTSTNSNWVMPAGWDERRSAVLDVGDGKKQNRPYFRAMEQQLLSGGFEGLLHHLMNLDLSTIDVGVIPQTDALADQKVHSLESVPRFWYECLFNGEISPGKYLGWPKTNEGIATEVLYSAYLERAIKWGDRRRVSDIQFGKELKLMTPPGAMERVKVSHKVVDSGGFTTSVRTWGYRIPDLDACRRAFDEALRIETNWPSEEDSVQLAKADGVPF
jgi:hypothetical protein